MKIIRILAAFSALLLMQGGAAAATSFSALYAFGDSLSDVGNSDNAAMSLYKTLGFCDPTHFCPPYDNGRLSNGPVASQYLAGALFPSGVTPSNFRSYAFAGANSGDSNFGFDPGGTLNLPGMKQEVNNYLEDAKGKADPNALYLVWGGANDYLGGDSATVAAQNIASYVSTLAGAGAKHILVPNLADLSLTPFGHNDGTPARNFSLTFDSALDADLNQVGQQHPGVDIFRFDTFALLNDVVQHPDKYGFTDTGDPCLTLLIPCGNPDQQVWWDDFHPTTRAHQVIGLAFATAVPEPEITSMLIAGLAILGVVAKRRRAIAPLAPRHV